MTTTLDNFNNLFGFTSFGSDASRSTIICRSKKSGLYATNGWLSPDGILYGCLYAQHGLLAEALVRKFKILVKRNVSYYETFRDAERTLELNQWIKYTRCARGVVTPAAKETSWFCFDKRGDIGFELTQKQYDTIFDWSQAHKEIPNCWNEFEIM